MNLVAANASGSRVFDREALEEVGWARPAVVVGEAVARMGVEYRNDLLGHVHALGVSRPPATTTPAIAALTMTKAQPPNSTACRDLRRGCGPRVLPPRYVTYN